jgi:hypothetical protein
MLISTTGTYKFYGYLFEKNIQEKAMIRGCDGYYLRVCSILYALFIHYKTPEKGIE